MPKTRGAIGLRPELFVDQPERDVAHAQPTRLGREVRRPQPFGLDTRLQRSQHLAGVARDGERMLDFIRVHQFVHQGPHAIEHALLLRRRTEIEHRVSPPLAEKDTPGG